MGEVEEEGTPSLSVTDVVDSEDEDTTEDEKNGSRTLVWILTLCVVLFLLGGIYAFKDRLFGTREASSIAVAENPAKGDILNIDAEVSDSTTMVNDTVTVNVVEEEVEVLVPIDTIKIEYGDTMRKLGLKYYGNRSFWVYIYLDNLDKIDNYNNVPLGTVLVIPAAKKYEIDANDKESLAKARKLEREYLSR